MIRGGENRPGPAGPNKTQACRARARAPVARRPFNPPAPVTSAQERQECRAGRSCPTEPGEGEGPEAELFPVTRSCAGADEKMAGAPSDAVLRSPAVSARL